MNPGAVPVAPGEPRPWLHQPDAKSINREVDILAEIAELQMKLVQKLGRKADLSQYKDVLSDASYGEMKISKESIVKSIKNQVYGKAKADEQSAQSEATEGGGGGYLQQTNMKNLLCAVLDPNAGTARTIVNKTSNDLKEFLGLDPVGETYPLVIFNAQGQSNLRQAILSKSLRLRELQGVEPELKETLKNTSERWRQKQIEDGEKMKSKKESELESYKLKVVELKLWKRKWQTQQRSLEVKKKKQLAKVEKRREWIAEQIKKGYMHKSCKVLIHSRSKFPFEPGFEVKPAAQAVDEPVPAVPGGSDNQAHLIKGVHVGQNGMVYPYKKTNVEDCTDLPPASNAKKRAKKSPKKKAIIQDNEMSETQRAVFSLQAATATDDQIPQPTVQEVHYIQEAFMDDVTEAGAPAVVHYIQLDPNNGIHFQ